MMVKFYKFFLFLVFVVAIDSFNSSFYSISKKYTNYDNREDIDRDNNIRKTVDEVNIRKRGEERDPVERAYMSEVLDNIEFVKEEWNSELKNFLENDLFLSGPEIEKYWEIVDFSFEKNLNSEELKTIGDFSQEEYYDYSYLVSERLTELLGTNRYNEYVRFKNDFVRRISDRVGRENFSFYNSF